MICPICNRSYHKGEFLPYGPTKRLFVGCPTPGCNSAERHRLACLFLLNSRILFNKTLHLGPERNMQLLLKKISKHYMCGDLEPNNFENMNCVFIDATNMSFFDNFFDLIYASHILEHIPDDRKAMQEMYRTLKPNGILLATIPQKFSEDTHEDFTITDPDERKKHFGQSDHVRYYGLDFSKRLKEQGFHITIYCHFSLLNKIENMVCDEKYTYNKESEKYNLGTNDILYICKKLVQQDENN
jgi:predicted SAM-dependent methyltransferase